MLRPIYLTLVIFFLFLQPLQADLTLVHQGNPQSIIVIPDQPYETILVAASEVQKYVEKISGAKLQIVKESQLSSASAKLAKIVIGPTKLTDSIGLNTDKLSDDGFYIKTQANNLYICGRDSVVAHAPFAYWHIGDCGTLYGVYSFLEQLGVRWYYPGDVGEVVPENKTISVSKLDIKKEPFFRFRLAGNSNGTLPGLYEPGVGSYWLRRIGMGATVHPWESGHPLRDWSEKYKKSNPEFFTLSGGKRTDHIGFPHPGVKKKVIEEITNYFKTHSATTNPYYCIIPNDWFVVMCECPLCKGKANEKRPWGGAFSDYLAEFVVDVANELKDKYPDRYILLPAYERYQLVPEKINKLPSNVGVMIAKTVMYQVDEKNRNDVQKLIRDWAKLKPREIFFFEYYNIDCQGGREFVGFPILVPRTVSVDMKFLKDLSLETGIPIGGQLIFPNGRGGDISKYRLWWWCLDHYVTAKLMWNPELDVASLLDEFYDLYFGPAAQPMKKLYEKAEWIWMNYTVRSKNANGEKNPWKYLMSARDMVEFDAYINQAKKQSAGTKYEAHVEFIDAQFYLIRERTREMLQEQEANLERSKYYVPFKKGAVKIDGQLNEAAWKDVPEINDFYVLGKNVLSESKTSVKIIKDNNDLFVAFTCTEPEINEIKADVTIDGGAVWEDDCVEVFLCNDSVNKGCLQVTVNSLGALYSGWLDVSPAQLPQVEVASKLTKNRWVAEIRIPLDQVVDKDQLLTKVNFTRTRRSKSQTEFCTWSRIDGLSYYQPHLFSWFFLSQEKGGIADFEFTPKWGENSLKLNIKSDNKVEELDFKVVGDNNPKDVKTHQKITDEKGNARIDCSFKIYQPGKYLATLNLPDIGNVVYPFYVPDAATIFLNKKILLPEDKFIEGKVRLNLNKIPQSQGTILIIDEKEKILFKKQIAKTCQGNIAIKIDVSDFKTGKYKLVFIGKDKSGKMFRVEKTFERVEVFF